MSDKDDKEMVELLWGITEKLDKILDALRKKLSTFPVEAKAGDSAAQMSIAPPE